MLGSEQNRIKTFKNNSNIRKETIQVTRRSTDGSYRLDFVLDANYECIVKVYLATTECHSAKGTPL